MKKLFAILLAEALRHAGFHPEIKSRPNRPHPLFFGSIGAVFDFSEMKK